MRTPVNVITGGGLAMMLAAVLGGCGKLKQTDPHEADKARAQAKRQQSACGSSAAYDRLKGLLFDQAIGGHGGDRANLDTLADYSFARMENPVVKGWDPTLDVIACKGRFVLQIPPGAQRGFGGEHRLAADVDYTAQAAADGSGFVYQLKGGEPIVARLAAFNLASGAYRPPPAIDQAQAVPAPSEQIAIARADMPAPTPTRALRPTPAPMPTPASTHSAPVIARTPVRPAPRPTYAPDPASEAAGLKPERPSQASSADASGELTVRAFYEALGAGDGEAASAQVVAEKRSSRAFSPDAISQFYGRLPDPIRLTTIAPLAPGIYRVRYRYSTGRSRCNGGAVVSLTNRGGRDLIRSIRAMGDC